MLRIVGRIEDRAGGVGGVLVSSAGRSIAWFGFQLDPDTCKRFGAADKETIIYELEMCAAVLALVHWRAGLQDTLPVSLIDNDAAHYSFICGSARGEIATSCFSIPGLRPNAPPQHGLLGCRMKGTLATTPLGQWLTPCCLINWMSPQRH